MRFGSVTRYVGECLNNKNDEGKQIKQKKDESSLFLSKKSFIVDGMGMCMYDTNSVCCSSKWYTQTNGQKKIRKLC